MSHLAARVKEGLEKRLEKSGAGSSVSDSRVQGSRTQDVAPQSNQAQALDLQDKKPQDEKLQDKKLQDEATYSIECSIQTLKRGDRTGVISQIGYQLSRQGDRSVNKVFSDARMLNRQLTASEVFVVKDLDGNRGYYLRMDTILIGDVRTKDSRQMLISQLLDHITQDIDILRNYFRRFPESSC